MDVLSRILQLQFTKLNILIQVQIFSHIGMKIVVIVVATVVVIAVVTLTMTSICVYLCTKKNCSVLIKTSSTARSIEIPTKKINNGTKDESCYETEFQDEHTYECM